MHVGDHLRVVLPVHFVCSDVRGDLLRPLFNIRVGEHARHDAPEEPPSRRDDRDLVERHAPLDPPQRHTCVCARARRSLAQVVRLCLRRILPSVKGQERSFDHRTVKAPFSLHLRYGPATEH